MLYNLILQTTICVHYSNSYYRELKGPKSIKLSNILFNSDLNVPLDS